MKYHKAKALPACILREQEEMMAIMRTYKRRWLLVAGACYLSLILPGCDSEHAVTAPASDQSQLIRIGGSTTLYPAFVDLADTWMKLHPGVKIVNTESSSGQGIKGLIAGDLEIARASRQFKRAEFVAASETGKLMKPYILGYDGVAIIVSPSKAKFLHGLTYVQLKDIFFTGKIQQWSQLDARLSGPIHVLVRDTSMSGTADLFNSHILASEKMPYVKTARTLHISTDLVPAVAEDENSIAYAPFVMIDERVAAVPLADGKTTGFVPCTIDTIRQQSYPLTRTLMFATLGGAGNAGKLRFIDFVLSSRGGQVLARHSVVPAE